MAPNKKDSSSSSSKSKNTSGGDKKNAGKKGGKDGDAGKDGEKGKEKGKMKGAQWVNVRHILVDKHSTLEQAKTALQQSQSFAQVAAQYSTDKARAGGSLGWKAKGSLLPEFEKVAFELEPSDVGKPVTAEVKTKEGWHLVMVEGRK